MSEANETELLYMTLPELAALLETRAAAMHAAALRYLESANAPIADADAAVFAALEASRRFVVVHRRWFALVQPGVDYDARYGPAPGAFSEADPVPHPQACTCIRCAPCPQCGAAPGMPCVPTCALQPRVGGRLRR